MDFKKCSLVTHHLNIITHHFITHYLSLKIPQLLKVACLALVSIFDNSKNFTFCGTHGLTWCNFYFLFLFFLFFFFLQPPIPKLTKPSEKEWKKEKEKETKPRNPMWKGKKRRKKKKRIEKPNLETQCEKERKEEKKE